MRQTDVAVLGGQVETEQYVAVRLVSAAARRAMTSLPRGSRNSVISCSGCDRRLVSGWRPGDGGLGRIAIQCHGCGSFNDLATAVPVSGPGREVSVPAPRPPVHSARLLRGLDGRVPSTAFDG